MPSNVQAVVAQVDEAVDLLDEDGHTLNGIVWLRMKSVISCYVEELIYVTPMQHLPEEDFLAQGDCISVIAQVPASARVGELQPVEKGKR